MKKIIVLSFLMFVFTGLIPSIVLADLLPDPGFHALGLCSKITNLDSFPDIVLIGFITGPGSGAKKYSAYQIKNGVCLDKGYKFNNLDVYWTTKEKFKLIDLQNLKLKTEKIKSGGYDENMNPMYYDSYFPADLSLLLKNATDFYSGNGLLPDSDPFVKVTAEYSISTSPNGVIALNKSRQISEYNNGTEPKIEIFNNPNQKEQPKITPMPTPIPSPAPLPEPVKRGFWQSVSCFFRGIFGFGC